MERFKRKLLDKEIQEFADFISDNAWGSVSVSTSEPASASEMKRNEIKLVDDKLIIRFPNGKVYKFTASGEIT